MCLNIIKKSHNPCKIVFKMRKKKNIATIKRSISFHEQIINHRYTASTFLRMRGYKLTMDMNKREEKKKRYITLVTFFSFSAITLFLLQKEKPPFALFFFTPISTENPPQVAKLFFLSFRCLFFCLTPPGC